MATRKQSKAEQDAETLAKLIEDIDITMFTTVGKGGALVSRPLSTQKAQFDGQRVWFFVSSDSPKIAEIRRNAQVNLAYASKSKNTYVSMSGDARVNNDPVKIEALWNDALKAFYPKGIRDPKLALLEVQVRTAEYWDGPGSLIGKAIAFAVARVTKREEAMGENRIIDLQGRKTSRLPPSHADARGGAKRAPAKQAASKQATSKKTATGKAASKKTAARGDDIGQQEDRAPRLTRRPTRGPGLRFRGGTLAALRHTGHPQFRADRR